jgi:hypothetical protein
MTRTHHGSSTVRERSPRSPVGPSSHGRGKLRHTLANATSPATPTAATLERHGRTPQLNHAPERAHSTDAGKLCALMCSERSEE